jgi:hypothetical protein
MLFPKFLFLAIAVIASSAALAAENKSAPQSAFYRPVFVAKPSVSGRVTGAIKSSQIGAIVPVGASPAARNRLIQPR